MIINEEARKEAQQPAGYQFEVPVAQLLASSMDPAQPDLGKRIVEVLDQAEPINDILLPPSNALVRQTEHIFNIEPSQFASFAQPYIEAITNEAEAQRADGTRVRVDIHLSPDQIKIKGNGKGMDFGRHFIGQVIRPHSGDPEKLRGQFGQGTLSYWNASESVSISSHPENPDDRGFDVTLKNNSEKPKVGKTIAGSLHSIGQKNEPGTEVIFDHPHFNGKALHQSHVRNIAEYIHSAVKNIYYADIYIHIDSTSECVNEAALQAEKYRAGDAEVLMFAGNKTSAEPYLQTATQIDIAGETVWSDQFHPDQGCIALNLPRQVMRAEARSLRHVELRDQDIESLLFFIGDVGNIIPEATKRAQILAALCRVINTMNITDQAKETITFSLVNQLTDCLENAPQPICSASTGYEKVVLPEGALLVPDSVLRQIPEELRTPAFDTVLGFSSEGRMLLSEFRSQWQEEFFIQIGHEFCVNKRLFDMYSRFNSDQGRAAVLVALNTEIKLYNLAHPSSNEQIHGFFSSFETGRVPVKDKPKERQDQPNTEVAPLSPLSTTRVDALRDAIPLSVSSYEYKKPEEPNTELASQVSERISSERWHDLLQKHAAQGRYSERNMNDMIEYHVKREASILYNQGDQQKDRKATAMGRELAGTQEALFGNSEEFEEIASLLLQLSEDEVTSFQTLSASEIFAPFLSFAADESPACAQQFSVMIDALDAQSLSNTWLSYEGVEHWLLTLLTPNERVQAHQFSVSFSQIERQAGIDELESKLDFSQKLREAWDIFEQDRPGDMRKLRLALRAKSAAHQLDSLLAKRKILAQPLVLNRYCADLASVSDKKWPLKQNLEQLESSDKPEKLSGLAIGPEQLAAIEHDIEFFDRIYAEAIRLDSSHRYNDDTPSALLDLTIHLCSIIHSKLGCTPRQLWVAHQNCQKIGVPSLLEKAVVRKGDFNSPIFPNFVDPIDALLLQKLDEKVTDDKLALLSSFSSLLLEGDNEKDSAYSAQDVLTQKTTVIMAVFSSVLLQDLDVSDLLDQAEVLIQAFGSADKIKFHSPEPTRILEIVYLLTTEPEATSQLVDFFRRHPTAPNFIRTLLREGGWYHSLGQADRVDSPYPKIVGSKIVSRVLTAAEAIIATLPAGVDLKDVTLSYGEGKYIHKKVAIVRHSGEETTYDLSDIPFKLLIESIHVPEVAWNPPEGSTVIDCDVSILQAAYLGFKAENRDLSTVSVEELSARTELYQLSLSKNQLNLYQRRLLSTINTQDADEARFFREWIQNTQNALVTQSPEQKFSAYHVGHTNDFRQFTKVVDFAGMSQEVATWNLGTTPGYKEGDALEGSLEKFHAGWLTCLNGASEVRVKTSLGDGKITWRQFFPTYQTLEGTQRKMVGVRQKTWVTDDPDATFGFTEMTRFELPGFQSYSHLQDNLDKFATVSKFHREEELTLYKLNEKNDRERSPLGVEYSLDELKKLHVQLAEMQQERVRGSAKSSSQSYRVQETAPLESLANVGAWGVDVIKTSSGSNQEQLVQGGFPIGDKIPEEIRRIIPEDIFKALREAGCLLVLRIPHTVGLNKARDSVNALEGFVEKSKNEVLQVVIKGIAVAMAESKIDSKMILAYDTSTDFMSRYSLRSEQHKTAIEDISADRQSNLDWVFSSKDPMTEIVRLALHVPIIRIPNGLPGTNRQDSNPAYSLMDAMAIKAGAAYLLQFEIEKSKDPLNLVRDLFLIDQESKQLVLSRQAIERIAWMARPSTQALQRLKQAKFITEQMVERSLLTKLAKKHRVFELLRVRLQSTQEARIKDLDAASDNSAVTEDEVRKVLMGEKTREVLTTAQAGLRTQEGENLENISPYKTIGKGKPRGDDGAYHALADLTVHAVRQMYPLVQFVGTNVGFYTEKKVESTARGGGGGVYYNVSPELSSRSTPARLQEALRANNYPELLGYDILGVIAHEAVHADETGWSSGVQYNGATHDLRFRRAEEGNYRRLAWWLLDPKDSEVPNIESIWSEYQQKYSSPSLVAGDIFHERLSQVIKP